MFPVCGDNFSKGRATYRFPYAMRHNDANNMAPHTPLYVSFPNFRKNRQIF